jgi:hypothetical protein
MSYRERSSGVEESRKGAGPFNGCATARVIAVASDTATSTPELHSRMTLSEQQERQRIARALDTLIGFCAMTVRTEVTPPLQATPERLQRDEAILRARTGRAAA